MPDELEDFWEDVRPPSAKPVGKPPPPFNGRTHLWVGLLDPEHRLIGQRAAISIEALQNTTLQWSYSGTPTTIADIGVFLDQHGGSPVIMIPLTRQQAIHEGDTLRTNVSVGPEAISQVLGKNR